MVQIKNSALAIALLIGFVGVFILGGWLGHSRRDNSAKASENALRSEIIQLNIRVKLKEYTVSQVRQELITERQLHKADKEEIQKLKALGIKKAQEITKLKLKIDTLLAIPHGGAIITVHDTVYANKKAILLPFNFNKQDKWLDLAGRFDGEGKLSMAIKMTAEVDAISGYKDKKPTLSLLTDNPYIKTLSIKSYKMDEQKPKSWAVGVQVGYGLALQKNPILTPYLGVGISRNIIRF